MFNVNRVMFKVEVDMLIQELSYICDIYG